MIRRIVDRIVQPVVQPVIEAAPETDIFSGVDLRVDPDRDDLRVPASGTVQELQKISGTMANFFQLAPTQRPRYLDNIFNGNGILIGQNAGAPPGSIKMVSVNAIASLNPQFTAQFMFAFGSPTFTNPESVFFEVDFGGGRYYRLALKESDKTIISKEFDGAVETTVGSFTPLTVNTPAIITVGYRFPTPPTFRNFVAINSSTVILSNVQLTGPTTAHDVTMLNAQSGALSTDILLWGEQLHSLTPQTTEQFTPRLDYLKAKYAIP